MAPVARGPQSPERGAADGGPGPELPPPLPAMSCCLLGSGVHAQQRELVLRVLHNAITARPLLLGLVVLALALPAAGRHHLHPESQRMPTDEMPADVPGPRSGKASWLV